MLDVALSILALIAGGVALEVFTTARASLRGWNEDRLQPGSGSLGMTEERQAGNPS